MANLAPSAFIGFNDVVMVAVVVAVVMVVVVVVVMVVVVVVGCSMAYLSQGSATTTTWSILITAYSSPTSGAPGHHSPEHPIHGQLIITSHSSQPEQSSVSRV